MNAEAVHQLNDELEAKLFSWAPILGVGEVTDLLRRVRPAAESIVFELAQDEDDRLAAEAVLTIVDVLGEPGPEWWSTPLGRLVARSVGQDDAEAWSQSVAGAVLGVTAGTIKQLRHRGKLDGHPDGGLTRASVLEYLLARRERPT